MTSYLRFLGAADGDRERAFQIAVAAFDHLAANVSVGMMRAGLPSDHTPKPRLVPLDVAKEDAPHG